MKNNKKLYLSTNDKKLGGVLGGLGEYFDMDPTVIRVLFIFLVIITGVVPGILAYFVMWLVIPERRTYVESVEGEKDEGRG